MIKLLVDIDDNYYNYHKKAGDIVSTSIKHENFSNKPDPKTDWRILKCEGRGAYIYARNNEWRNLTPQEIEEYYFNIPKRKKK